MTLDELRIKLKLICDEATADVPPELMGSVWPQIVRREVREKAADKLGELFQSYRDDIFKISKRVPAHWELEKELADRDNVMYQFLRRNALAFFTCSCGSRVDSG